MTGSGSRPLVVIGLDGATFDLLTPWMRAGGLPALAELCARGAWARLESTMPAATFPAWTSLFTGVNPGRHGVLDFLQRVDGSHRLRLVDRRDRRVKALWNRLAEAGRRVAVLTVPVTYPPEPLPGIMVSGWDSPLATAIDASFVSPREFYPDIQRTIGRLPFADFQELTPGPGWHARALASLLDGIERRTRLAELVLAREPWDLLAVVYGESDTVAHHFWRLCDPSSPRWEPGPFVNAIREVYEALDAAVSRLLRATPPDAAVAIVSDHGSGGAGTRVVYLNRRLADGGLLHFASRRSNGPIRTLRRGALACIPHRWQGALVRSFPSVAGRLEGLHRAAGIDWTTTVAFSEELDYHPSVRLNLAGREPQGIVVPAEYGRTRDAVAAQLEGWVDASGRPVVRRVWRREEVLHGEAVEHAPDLLLELELTDGYSPSCLRSDGPGPALRALEAREYGAGRGAGMSGAHRRDGIVVLCGGGVRQRGDLGRVAITDVLPTLLALSGLPVPMGLDGRVLTEAIDGGNVVAGQDDPLLADDGSQPARAQDQAEVMARLQALGYLEPGAR